MNTQKTNPDVAEMQSFFATRQSAIDYFQGDIHSQERIIKKQKSKQDLGKFLELYHAKNILEMDYGPALRHLSSVFKKMGPETQLKDSGDINLLLLILAGIKLTAPSKNFVGSTSDSFFQEIDRIVSQELKNGENQLENMNFLSILSYLRMIAHGIPPSTTREKVEIVIGL